MSMIFNGTQLTNVYFNETQLDKVYFNGTLVFERTSVKYKFIYNTYEINTVDISYIKTDCEGFLNFIQGSNNYIQNPTIEESYGRAMCKITFNLSSQKTIGIGCRGDLGDSPTNPWPRTYAYISNVDTDLANGTAGATRVQYLSLTEDKWYTITMPAGTHFITIQCTSDWGGTKQGDFSFIIKEYLGETPVAHEEYYSASQVPNAIKTMNTKGIQDLTIEEVEQ